MAKKRTGLIAERVLTDHMRSVGIRFRQSHELDTVHKIDALITSIRGLKGPFDPIGFQITQMRGNREKIWTFIREAPNGTDGPLLYAEIVGKANKKMALAIKAACKEIWTNPQYRRRRYFGIIVDSKGKVIWFNPRKTPRPRSKK